MTLNFIVSVAFGTVVFIRTLYGMTADQVSLNDGVFKPDMVTFTMSIIYGAVAFMLCNKILSL